MKVRQAGEAVVKRACFTKVNLLGSRLALLVAN